jgi:hypothetical protein
VREKENDEWAKLALVNTKDLIYELRERRLVEGEKKRKVREEFDKQISFKNSQLNNKKDFDNYYQKVQSELNEKFDRSQSQKKENLRQEILKVNEIRSNIVKSK